jgi:uncharacterized protein (UPF0335 family)
LNNLALVESQSLREQYIEKIEVLEKVKPLTILKDDTHVTVEMAANYYDVPVETVKSLIKNNNEELVLDGLRTLDGEQLRSFKDLCQIQSRVKALTIIPRRAVLRIGMLLRDSEVAKQIRSYLLNVESLTSDDIKNQAFDKLIEQNNVLTTEVQDLKDLFSTEITSLKDQIGILEKNSYFSRMKNPSREFDRLLNYYAENKNIGNLSWAANALYKDIEAFFEVPLPEFTPYQKNAGYNKKQFIIREYGTDFVDQFVHGIMSGRFIKNDNGIIVDNAGVFENPFEWEKIKKEFNHSCAYCGISGVTLQREHLIPSHKFNSSDCIHNIVPSCPGCNSEKHLSNWDKWYTTDNYRYDEDRYQKIVDHIEKYKVEINDNE